MKKQKEEGHYSIQRVEKLPTKGNANFLYAIQGSTLEAFYRWLPNGTWEVIALGAKAAQVVETIETVETIEAILTYPVENYYEDEAEMLADQANQTKNYFQFLVDTETYYEYLGTTNAAIGDYRKLTVEETTIINGRTLPPVQRTYASVSAMYNNQKKQTKNYLMRVSGTDGYYHYLGTKNKDASDYVQIGAGASTLLALTDAPSTYTGEGGKVVAVKGTEDGVEFIPIPVPDVIGYGQITEPGQAFQIITGFNYSWEAVAYGEGTWVTTGGSKEIGVSKDNGYTWTKKTRPTGENNWYALTHGKGRFVGLSYNTGGTKVLFSDDAGDTWKAFAPQTSVNNASYFALTYGNGYFVAGGNGSGTSRVIWSLDGLDWKDCTTPPANTTVNGGCYGEPNGVPTFLLVGANYVAYSTDNGVTWTETQTGVAANTWQDVCWSPADKQFVAVSSSGTLNKVMTSPDGITWTAQVSPATERSWMSITWGNGVYVAVAGITQEAFHHMWSTDGVTWNLTTNSSQDPYQDIAFGNGVFIAVANNGIYGRALRIETPTIKSYNVQGHEGIDEAVEIFDSLSAVANQEAHITKVLPIAAKPSTTRLYTIKGAYFTPELCRSFTFAPNTNIAISGGCTVLDSEFINENEIRVRVTTPATEGDYDITLNNGGQISIFPKAFTVLNGTPVEPHSFADWENVSGNLDLTDKVDISVINANGNARWSQPFDYTQDFEFRFQFKGSVLGTITGTVVTEQIQIVNEANSRLFSVSINYANPYTKIYTRSAADAHVEAQVNIYQYGYYVNLGIIERSIYKFRWVGGVMTFWRDNTLLRTFTDSITENMKFAVVDLDTVNVKSIKYINLTDTTGQLDVRPRTSELINDGPDGLKPYSTGAPYKAYSALLRQIGAGAPTEDILENTLGGTPVFSYVGAGHYRATLTGAFPSLKTFVSLSLGSNGYLYSTGVLRLTDNLVDIYVARNSDQVLVDDVLGGDSSFEIRVYD